MRVSAGNGGWFRVDDVDGLPGPVYVRFAPVDGRVRITELYIDGRGNPVQAGALRRLPIAAWESEMAGEWESLVADVPMVLVPGPDLSRLASHFATTFGPASKADHWIAESMRAQLGDGGARQAPMGKDPDPVEQEPEPVVLTAPQHGLTDDFLGDVARAYEAAVHQRRPPASALAEAAGVERRTVESWIYKARKRGIMRPAAKRGRVV